jgi:putative transposase
MLINVSTGRFGRAVRLPEGDISAAKGTGVSQSAVSGRFVALSAERMAEWMAEWMAAGLSKLDLPIIRIDGIRIDGIHIDEDLMLLAAVGIDGEGGKHPLGVIEGATENAAVAQALLANLVGRGLDPRVCRLFIIDRAKALSKACPGEGRGRSARPSAATPRSSAARFTRPATSPSAWPSRCTPACARRCVRRGNSMTPRRRKS